VVFCLPWSNCDKELVSGETVLPAPVE
jgi:hypothetical protein